MTTSLNADVKEAKRNRAEQAFWTAFYGAIMAMAYAIRRYKLDGATPAPQAESDSMAST